MMKLKDLAIYAYNLFDGSVMERRSNWIGGVSLIKGDLINLKVDRDEKEIKYYVNGALQFTSKLKQISNS